MLFMSAPTAIYYLKEGTAQNVMPFLETGGLASVATYVDELVTEMHRAYKAGYVFKTDGGSRIFRRWNYDYKTEEMAPALEELRQREAQADAKEMRLTLGYGNQSDLGIDQLIALFPDEDAMATITYLSDLSIADTYAEWKKKRFASAKVAGV